VISWTGILWGRTLCCKRYVHWKLESVSQKTTDQSSLSDPWPSGRKLLLPVIGSNAAVKHALKTGQPMTPWAVIISGWGKPRKYDNL
jgi:hypothetical protein